MVESKEEGSPIAGVYDDVSVRSGGVLYLATGEYEVRRFDVASGGKIIVDSRRGPVRVQVRELLKLGGAESAVDAVVRPLPLEWHTAAVLGVSFRNP